MRRLRRVSLYMAVITIISLILTSMSVQPVYAENITLRSGGFSLDAVILADSGFTGIGDNMLPGEAVQSHVVFANTDTRPFVLTVHVDEKSGYTGVVDEQPDLLDVLTITVSNSEGVVSNFPAKSDGEYIIGLLNPGDTTLLIVNVTMDGENVHNEYQSLSNHVEWTFSAAEEKREEPVPTPGPLDPDVVDPGGRGTRVNPGSPATGTTSTPAIPTTTTPTTIGVENTPMGYTELVDLGEPVSEEVKTIMSEGVPLGITKENPKTGFSETLFRVQCAVLAVSVVMFAVSLKESIKPKRKTSK